MRAEVDSPTYLGGLWVKTGRALVDPARLAWELRRVALELGARLYEHSAVTHLRDDGAMVLAETAHGHVRARRCVLATNAYPPLLRRIGAYVVPVYDYVLMTEPLTDEQRASIGWQRRQGLADCTNQFHYYRQTDDGRILWGGYDAVYHFRNGFGPSYEQRAATHELLAQQFFDTFPQLAGSLRFSHRWGGAIDTCSRFSVFFGTAHGGKTSPTPPATPGSASAPPGSAPAWRSTWPTAARPRRRGPSSCARSRCRSRPSRCATPASR